MFLKYIKKEIYVYMWDVLQKYARKYNDIHEEYWCLFYGATDIRHSDYSQTEIWEYIIFFLLRKRYIYVYIYFK